jgi:GTPase Era involved in 16S rRNA processing
MRTRAWSSAKAARGSSASAAKRGRSWNACWDAKVFLELWVKVRSGWADDESHLRSYGYE